MCIGVLITYKEQIPKFQDFHFRKNVVKMNMRVFNYNSQHIKLLLSTLVFLVILKGGSQIPAKRVKNRTPAGFEFHLSHFLSLQSSVM